MITTPDGGISAGHEFVWSDWSLHIGLTSIFAYKDPTYWFAYHPVYADGKLTYPFLTNLISGLLLRLGFDLPFSMNIPSVIFVLLLLWGMHSLYSLILKTPLKPASNNHLASKVYLAISLFFLSSGLGFLNAISEWLRNPSIEFLLNPPKRYSELPDFQWGSGNNIVGLLLPQRAFLLGMTLAVWAISGLLYPLLNPSLPEKRKKTVFALSGLAGGLLPIAHAHSFIAMIFLTSGVFLVSFRRWKELLYFVVPFGSISVTLYLIFVRGGIQSHSFMSWHPWYTSHGLLEWLWFWGYVWGPLIPAAAAGLFILWKHAQVQIRALLVSAFLLFAVGNLIYFQPIAWDNSKLFLWCYFCFSALAAHFIFWLWENRLAGWKLLNKLNAKPLAKAITKPLTTALGVILVVTLVITLTLTGLLELIKVERIDTHTFQLLTREEVELAETIREKTGPMERFLTAPSHDHPIAILGARPILLGYTAWVFNYGFDYSQTEREMPEIYRGTPQSDALLMKHRISYVVFGPREFNHFHPNEDYFKAKFPIAFQTQNYRIYDVRTLLK